MSFRVARHTAASDRGGGGAEGCHAGTREHTRTPCSFPSPSSHGCICAACRYARILFRGGASEPNARLSRVTPRRAISALTKRTLFAGYIRDNMDGEGGELSPRFALFIMLREPTSTPVLPPRIAAPRRGLLITTSGSIDNN